MLLTESDKLLSLLQICDSGYPTGGFSHSGGLEAALKTRTINDKDSLREFLHCILENIGAFAIPFVREGYQSCLDTEKLSKLDQLCEASTPNHVAKRASARQGSSMLDTSIKVFKRQHLASLVEGLQYRHQSVVYGAVCGTLEMGLEAAVLSFLYNGLRSVVASAIRLDKIGPIEGQAIQAQIQRQIPDIIQRHKWRSSDDACVMYPHADIVQNIHDTMFTKLFYS